jgi:hypothetical protein
MATRARKNPPQEAQAQPFQLSLHIRHPSLDPQKISETLWLQAVDSVTAGAPREGAGRPSSVHQATYWAAEIPLAASDFLPTGGNPEVMRALSAVFAARAATLNSVDMALSVTCFRYFAPHAEFFKQMQLDGGTARLLVTLLPAELNGFTLTPDLSRLLAELGIAVEFDFLGQMREPTG